MCRHCGTALRARPWSEERKLVTVLFADVEASTELARVLGAETLREQLERFYAIARAEIQAHGGTVEKFIGDAVLAVFGLPAIHEDDPVRAVRAALAIQSRMRPGADAGQLLRIRIGLNTGLVVADPRAIEQGDFLVTGESVHLAARLQQHGRPGQVLVGETTYQATRWAFSYRPGPMLKVKGFPDDVVTYECLEQRLLPLPRQTWLEGFGSPLVGRAAEVETILHSVEQLETGRGGIVAVIGDPGIGKSRLLAEARQRVTDRRLLWLEGRSLFYSRGFIYWPFREIIKSAAGITDHDGPAASWAKLQGRVAGLAPAQVADIVPYLGTLLGLEAPVEWADRVRYLDGEAMGRQIYRSSRLFFEALARAEPVVLVFEDLHWVDHASSGLLEHLLPLTAMVPILFCGLGRPEPETPAAHLRDLAANHYRERYTEIVLHPLTLDETDRLVRNLLRLDDLQPTLRDIARHRAEGNPFFVEEILRSLIDARVIVRDGAADRWRIVAPLEQITVPDTLRGVIMARVDRLGEDVKQVLKTAAVIGRGFLYRVLRAVSGAGDRLDDCLDELQRVELIRIRRFAPELEFFFKHAVTQEATYESILVRQRRELHHQVGQAIEALFADRLEEFYSTLAYHYARAEEWQKAQDYLLKAGDQAGRIAADTEALAFYRQATEAYSRAFGDQWDPLQRAGLERKMGEAFQRRGEHTQAMQYFHRALALLGAPFPGSRPLVRTAIVMQLLRQLGHRVRPGGLPPRLETQSSPAVEERCRLYESMAWIDYFVDLERVSLEALLLLNVSERHAYAFGIARGLAGMGFLCLFLPAYPVAGFYHRRAVSLAEETRHPLAIGLAHLGLAFYTIHGEGKWQEAQTYFVRSARAYKEAGELRQWGAAATMVAWVSRVLGDVPAALEQCQEIMKVGRDAADPQVMGWGLAEQGAAFLQLGKLDQAISVLRRALELFTPIPDFIWMRTACTSLGQCYLLQNRLAEALVVLEEAARIVEEKGFRGYERTQPLAALAEAYLRAAEQPPGGEPTDWLRKAELACRTAVRQSRIDSEGLPGACRVQGTYLWLRNQRSSAEQWWRRSLEASDRLGAKYELAMTLQVMGHRMSKQAYADRAEAILHEMGAGLAPPGQRESA